MEITVKDRMALLKERVVVHSVHHFEKFGTQVYVTGPDGTRARELVAERLGDQVEVTVCGTELREIRPRACDGHMEREAGRLQLRYSVQREEHLDEIVVAEDGERVVVLGAICAPIGLLPGHLVECPYHVYLEQPLGDRTVIDAVTGTPVPYFNVYDGIFERVERTRAAGG
jgi:hypothetical protein